MVDQSELVRVLHTLKEPLTGVLICLFRLGGSSPDGTAGRCVDFLPARR